MRSQKKEETISQRSKKIYGWKSRRLKKKYQTSLTLKSRRLKERENLLLCLETCTLRYATTIDRDSPKEKGDRKKSEKHRERERASSTEGRETQRESEKQRRGKHDSSTECPPQIQAAIPKFRGFYDHWSMMMENFLRSKEMWSLVEEGVPVLTKGTTASEAQKKIVKEAKLKDLKIKNFLIQAIDKEVMETILDKGTAKAIWDSMKQKYQGSTKVRRDQLQALRREFELLSMKEGEKVDRYLSRKW